MKLAPVIAVASLAVLASQAFADEKSDAILKEVARRAANITTYSVTIKLTTGKDQMTMRYWLVRPGKIRVEMPLDSGTAISIANDSKTVGYFSNRSWKLTNPVPKELFQTSSELALGMIDRLVGGIEKSQYVTQKMIDEATVVDVIDVWGKRDDAHMRVYIDNNSQVRRIAGRDKNSSGMMIFLNPIVDEPIPNEKFAIPKDKL